MKLSELAIHQKATVKWIHAQGDVGEQLLEMGLTPGVAITLMRRGPFGNPLELMVRGYRLSIHKQQAASIEITL